MRIPLKPTDPDVRRLVRAGLFGAWLATFMYFCSPLLPAFIQRYAVWLYDIGLAIAVACCTGALLIGGLRGRGGPPTAH